MKKELYAFFLILSLSFLALPSFAQEDVKTILLSDGTKIKGTIMSFNDGAYRISTSNLGEITVNDKNIVSISSTDTAEAVNPQASNTDIKNQVGQMQNMLMADPQLLQEIQGLMDDPEVMKLLEDKNFINDVMSYDPNRIESNEKTQQLMQNPKIQALMNKIHQKNSGQGQVGQP